MRGEAATENEAEPGTPRRHLLRDPTWWASFAVFFTLTATWAFASPLFSVNDEPAHVVKAAAVARGELLGRKLIVPDRPGQYVRGGFTTVVDVPFSYTWQTSLLPTCYIFDTRVSADCAPAFVDDSKSAKWTTWVGRQPPTFYLLVGWSTLLDTGTHGIYLMRLLNAVLCCALLATAMSYARAEARFRLVALGVAVAATPTALFLAGAVNPTGLETAAAICLWVCLSVATQRAGRGIPTHLLATIGVAGAVFAFIRPLSAFWLLVIVGTVALLLPNRRRLVELWQVRGVRVVGTVLGVVVAGAALWTILADALGNVAGEDPRGLGFIDAAIHSLKRTDLYMKEMLAVFGWRTTPAPTIVYVAWVAAVLTLVGLAIWLASRRFAAVIVGLGVFTVVVPVFIEALNAKTNGFAWQGRYALPIAAGVPILATLGVGMNGRLSARATARVTAILVTVVAAAHIAAHYSSMRRYVVGSDGPFLYIGKHGWSPPLPAALLLVTMVAGAAGLAVLTYRIVTCEEQLRFARGRAPAESSLAVGA